MSVPGKRVLITEDEFFLALCLGQVLEEQGYAVIGPAGDVEEALELIEKGQLSGAILDINLNGNGLSCCQGTDGTQHSIFIYDRL